jgi:hypothetical protein
MLIFSNVETKQNSVQTLIAKLIPAARVQGFQCFLRLGGANDVAKNQQLRKYSTADPKGVA